VLFGILYQPDVFLHVRDNPAFKRLVLDGGNGQRISHLFILRMRA